ncbi:MAG: HAD family hydrolase [Rhodospirillaceae bacterium]|nr:HAD family hydrolase [Rhodospirillaceae bacterium]MBT5664100.1 HAD family hydrolase [Rhodospirillaceae bacterium]
MELNGGALILDRDGVIVEEVNYLHRVEHLQLIPGAAVTIAHANAKSIPVVIVTNQSGVGRGYYDWAAFAALQNELLKRLGEDGAIVNMVLACGYHKDALAPYRIDNHPWRKPGPGMLHSAAESLGFDLARSWLVGDSHSDINAARSAGLAGAVHVLSGHGRRDRAKIETQPWPGLEIRFAESMGAISDDLATLFGPLPN